MNERALTIFAPRCVPGESQFALNEGETYSKLAANTHASLNGAQHIIHEFSFDLAHA